MRVDFRRLLLVLIVFYIAQILLGNFLVSIGLNGITFVIIYNFLLSFIAGIIYYPSNNRTQLFKDPEFYRTVGIFFLIFLLVSMI